MSSVDEAKKRVDRSQWFFQKQATRYAGMAKTLYHQVEVSHSVHCSKILEVLTCILQRLSTQLQTKELFERNNMSYTSRTPFTLVVAYISILLTSPILQSRPWLSTLHTQTVYLSTPSMSLPVRHLDWLLVCNVLIHLRHQPLANHECHRRSR